MTRTWNHSFRRHSADSKMRGLLAMRQANEAQRRVQPQPNRETLAMGAPVTATFIGLFILDQLIANRQAQAEAGSADAAEPQAIAFDDQESVGQSSSNGDSSLTSGAPSIEAGSILAAGGLIEPSLLSTISGNGQTPELGEAEATLSASSVQGDGSDTNIDVGDLALAVSNINLPGEESDDVSLYDNADPIGDFSRANDNGDTISGTDRADTLLGGDGEDLLSGLAGNDRLDGYGGDDQIFGGAGEDIVTGGLGSDELHGGGDNDNMSGDEGSDFLYGDAGRDQLSGGEGDDWLEGGAGGDITEGGAGNDTHVVDAVDDVAMESSLGADQGGNDTVIVRGGFADSLSQALPGLSPEGKATFSIGGSAEDMPANANSFRQVFDSDMENIQLEGTDDHDVIGDDGDNRLTGNDGNNQIWGQGGDDHLEGDDGDDILYGDAGDDWLSGGDGADFLYGGAGDDSYMMGLNDSAVDTVFDHEGANRIQIDVDRPDAFRAIERGEDLVLQDGERDVAIIKDYQAAPESFAGVEFADGFAAMDSIIEQADPTVPDDQSDDEIATSPDESDDWLADFLPANRVEGGEGSDVLNGSEQADWITGGDGNDRISAGDGDDLIEGGHGSDTIFGGAGDDTFVIANGDQGIDRIDDDEGDNTLRLDGFDDAPIGGFMLGGDLWVTADSSPIAVIEDFSTNSNGTIGQIQSGERTIDPRDIAG